MRRPNLLLIMADQFRADWIGAAGASWVQTPNIDSIAARGVRFERAYTTCPVCVPARLSLATGMDPARLGAFNNQPHLDLKQRTYYSELRDAGYRVGCAGKLDLAKNDFEMGEGDRPWTYSWGFTDPVETEGKMSAGTLDHVSGPYTRFLESKGLWETFSNDYKQRAASGWIRDALHDSPLPADATADAFVGRRAVEWLRSVPDEHPWHLFVSFVGPHDPFDPPTPYAEIYRNADIPGPTSSTYSGASATAKRRVVNVDDAEILTARRHYSALIHLIDDWIGEILATIDEIGARDETIVIFTSDHGEMLGDHGMFQKSIPYESATRIPLIVSGPGIAEGVTSEALVELHDLNPTICELCGVEPTSPIDAISFQSVLAEPSASHRSTALNVLDGHRALVDSRFKYIWFTEDDVEELYDLEADPAEIVNIAESDPARAAELRRTLEARLKRTASTAP